MVTKRRVLVVASVLSVLALGAWGVAGGAAGWLFLSDAHRTIRLPAELGLTRSEIRSGDGTALGVWQHTLPDARATVVMAHGFRSDPNHWEPLIPRLTAARLQSVALEFRAHGQSGGRVISMGWREREDVAAALDHAQHFGLPVLFVGFSMGAASYLLGGREAHAAVLDSPYDALPSALRARWSGTHLPFFVALPAYLTVWARLPVAPSSLRPVDHVRALHNPTRFVFAELDHWVPGTSQARFRDALCPTCSVDFIRAKGHGDHNDDAWAERVTAFLVGTLAPETAPAAPPIAAPPIAAPPIAAPPTPPTPEPAPVVLAPPPTPTPVAAPVEAHHQTQHNARHGGWCKHHRGQLNPATGERCPG